MRNNGNKKALGEAAKTVMVSSIKGNTGHLLGAAGGIEAIASIKVNTRWFCSCNNRL